MAALHQNVPDVALEDASFQNAPELPANHQLLQQQRRQQLQLDQQEQQLAAITNQLNDIQARYGYISSANSIALAHLTSPHLSLNRLPMQLLNATGITETPLQYPPGIVPGPPLPLLKKELYEISGRLRLEMLGTRYSLACCSCRLRCLTCSPWITTCCCRGSHRTTPSSPHGLSRKRDGGVRTFLY